MPLSSHLELGYLCQRKACQYNRSSISGVVFTGNGRMRPMRCNLIKLPRSMGCELPNLSDM